jgi:hypothetical protein
MKKTSLSLALICVMGTGMMFSMTGCSAQKAMNQPDKKDVSVLKKGTPRYEVIGEFGKPLHTMQSKDGHNIDIFSFIQGYSKGSKAARAFGHTLMDIGTLGMWEIVGSPVEAAASGDKVTVKVQYDEADLVDTIVAIKGKDELNFMGKSDPDTHVSN